MWLCVAGMEIDGSCVSIQPVRLKRRNTIDYANEARAEQHAAKVWRPERVGG